MIDLSDNDDPMLFAVTVPQGRLVCQFMEVIAAAQGIAFGKEPTVQDLCRAIREASRTPDVAKAAPDHVLIAAFSRMQKAVESAGNR